MMTSHSTYIKNLFLFFIFMFSFAFSQKEAERELRRLNAKIDRIRVQVDSLELDNQILLPELMLAFKQAVKSKTQQDSVTLVILKRINTLSNKIGNLENQSRYMDSSALEIRNDLIFIDNKLVTLTKTYNEMYNLKADNSHSAKPQIDDEQYKKLYTESLGALQSSEIETAKKGFSKLLKMNVSHDLADNAQYWLGECYYSQKEYMNAIKEYGKVFTFINSNKEPDAQYKIALSYQSLGLIEKARVEFQRMVDYHPGSGDNYLKAKEALKHLSIN